MVINSALNGIIRGFVSISEDLLLSMFRKHIYGPDGYNSLGFDKEGYNRDGFNKNGLDREGYDKSGFNSQGYNREGYNRGGYDKQGYNCLGFDSEGYDRKGYNSEGYDRSGFDRCGYNSEGYNRSGFDRLGYNSAGLDCSGHDKAYYIEVIVETENNALKAKHQLDDGEYAYALRDIRVGLEKCLKALVSHHHCSEPKPISSYLSDCWKNDLLDYEMHDKVRAAIKHCNDMAHNDYDKTYKQVHFCLIVLDELRFEVIKATSIGCVASA